MKKKHIRNQLTITLPKLLITFIEVSRQKPQPLINLHYRRGVRPDTSQTR